MPTTCTIPDFALVDRARLAGMIDPQRTALLVIDIQHDFVAPDGFCGRAGADLSAMDAAVEAIERAVAAARRAGLVIAFLRVVTRPETDGPAMLRLMARRGRAGGASLCRAEGGGADYHRVVPLSGDLEIEKNRYDGFLETRLDAELRARGIDAVIATGVATDCCVDSTARAAFQRDYDVFVVTDACAASAPHLHAGALAALEQNVALLVDTDTLVAALGDASDRETAG